jgi:crotonobetainyl-CoA:carnitine CoA-transferase CaiB-like acyl-CoA transferase
MVPEAKFWDRFLEAVGREDLKEKYPAKYGDFDRQSGNKDLQNQLEAIFKTRTREEWIALFLEANIAGGPVNRVDEIPSDPHFAARDNVYSVEQPETGPLMLLSTPIKIEGQRFSAGPAPFVGQHTEEVLRQVLALDDDRIAQLRETGAIAMSDER